MEIRRVLTAAFPDRYRPDLADSLRVLANVLDTLGNSAEADTARREADLGQ